MEVVHVLSGEMQPEVANALGEENLKQKPGKYRNVINSKSYYIRKSIKKSAVGNVTWLET